jgi:hypothetical protein
MPPAMSRAIVQAPAPVLMTSADVDARLREVWRAVGVEPNGAADDATWLRRLWIDVAGTLPPPDDVRAFLADASAGKRARAIDALLASPRWADHWTAYWDDVWMGRDTRSPDVDGGAFRAWLHDAFARNEPWNQVATELLTAVGRNSTGRSHREADADEGRDGAAPGVQGAVNWTLKYQEAPQDLAGAASRTLLGVQIQCAQCHDHKTEKWTQGDFQRFAAAFVRTRLEPVEARSMGSIRAVDVSEIRRAAPRYVNGKKGMDLGSIVQARPTALDGTALGHGGEGDRGDGNGGEVREDLARWVTGPQNPWFARALVNRMWGHFMGRGFVDPVDDLRPSNAPVAPALLDALAADFVGSGYDLKHLVGVIVGSAAYAVSAAPPGEASAKADPEAKLWGRFRVTPLGPEELLDSVIAGHRPRCDRRTNRAPRSRPGPGQGAAALRLPLRRRRGERSGRLRGDDRAGPRPPRRQRGGDGREHAAGECAVGRADRAGRRPVEDRGALSARALAAAGAGRGGAVDAVRAERARARVRARIGARVRVREGRQGRQARTA